MSTSDRTAVSTFERVAVDLTHQPFPAMAAAIHARSDRILRRWRRLGLKAMPHLDALTQEEFEDTIAEILSAAADALDSADPQCLRGVIESGPGHGIDRFIQKYSLLDLFEEVRILRNVVIVEMAEQMCRPLEVSEAATFHAIFDLIIQQGVMALVHEQETCLQQSQAATLEMNEQLLISSVRQHELTEQAQIAETALRGSEQRFRTLFELGPVAVYSCDASGVIREFNRRAAELWGRAPSLGDTDERFCGSFRMIRPDGSVMAHEQCPMAEVLSGKMPHVRDAEVRIDRPDGSRITVVVNIRPLKNEKGEITGAINCFYDITERKKGEEVTARLAAIVASSDDAIISKDLDGIITSWNHGAQRLFGYTAEEVIGKSVYLLIPEDHLDEEPRILTRIRQGKSVEHYETVRRRKDGCLVDISLAVSPIKNGVGQIIGASKVARDITERKQAEQALRESERRFRHVAEEAEAANRAKDIFLATLSHEMRTPLSAIVGWMQILHGGLEGGCCDAELNEGLDVVERNAKTMVQLLDDVMDVSRIVSGKVRLEVRPCDLSTVIRAGIDVVRSAARAREIELTAELDPAASAASCDAARMQQVVWNLLSNAIKFTPKGGTVRITLAREQSDLRIQVSDSGQGIDPELLPYVFDRFRQADSSTRRRFGGLGLGLSIVKHLVELHGGTVHAQSEGEGRGSTFTVLLPIRAVRTDESGDDLEANESGLRTTTGLPLVRLDALRVLVVDDEPDARRLLVKVLREAGAVVTAAASAPEAIEALQKSNPEVIVSDLGMPDEDGFDLIREIRAHGHHAKDLPAVALTAFVHKNYRREALLAGFQTHVPKPADPHDLTAVIASLAGRTGPA